MVKAYRIYHQDKRYKWNDVETYIYDSEITHGYYFDKDFAEQLALELELNNKSRIYFVETIEIIK